MRARKTVIFVMGSVLLAAYAYRQRYALISIMSVFAFAAAFTLMLAPICRALERRGVRAGIAAGAAVCCILLVLVLLVSALVPYLISHTTQLMRRITPTMTVLIQDVRGWMAETEYFGKQQQTADTITAIMGRLTSLLAKGGVSAAENAGRVIFALVLTYYLLRERKAVSSHLLLLVPSAWRLQVLSALNGCKNAVLGYLSGMLKTSMFVSLATYIGLLLLGIQDALILALFMGVFEVFPYIGPVLAAVPILLSSLPQGLQKTVFALLLVVFVQQIEGSFVSPYFTASSTSIHPLAALVSVFVLGSLFGIWGVLLAVPLVVTIRSVLWSVRQARCACV